MIDETTAAATQPSSRMLPRLVFLLCLLVSASGFVSPPVALGMGLVFGLALAHPYGNEAKKFSKFLLQASVVGLGFGMNLHQVVRAGRSGFVYTMFGISFALLAGMGLGALLSVQRVPAFLISTGTAICGGSAIAAVGPITQASDEEMAISLGTVFVLNSVALLIFPSIGAGLKLTQSQFGLWAALAIHDTSSVVGAAAKYGAEALAIATTVKLARALWIVPLSLATAVVRGTKAKIQWPWFIGLFCLAAICNTYLPSGAHVYGIAVKVAKVGLTATLFLIGSGISVATIKEVGHRPLLQGIILWLLVSVGSLWLIHIGWIAL
ncbi:MAG: putative sulfate exporter family transporter [Candidatus Sulfotelmatobacter sp.]